MIYRARLINAGFGLALVLLVAVSALFFWNMNNLGDDNARVNHTRQVLTSIESVYSILLNAETGQRGYLLTGQDSYLDPYNTAVASIDQEVKTLRQLTVNSPEQQQSLDRLEPLISSKMAELARTVDLRKTQGADAALQAVLTNEGKQAMDDIRSVLTQMETFENEMLQERMQISETTSNNTNIVAIVAVGIVFVLLLISFLVLRNSRDALDQRVKERTAELAQANLNLQAEVAERKEAERVAQDQREWFRVTLASIGDAVIATDKEGAVTLMNAVAETLTGWQLAQASQEKLARIFNIVNEETRQPVENPVDKVLRIGEVVGLANHTVLIAKDDIERPIDDSGAPIRDSSGEMIGVVLVFRDITERRQWEQRQQFWTEIMVILSSSLDYEVTFNNLAHRLVPQFADYCSVSITNPDGATSYITAAARDKASESQIIETLQRFPAALDPTTKHDVVENHKVMLIPELTDAYIETSAQSPDQAARIGKLGVRSMIRIPLIQRDRLMGILSISMAGSGRRYSEGDLSFAEELRRRATIALENSTLYREAQAAVRIRDEFLSVAAHELKTPVTSIRGFAQLLLRQLDKNAALDSERVRRNMQMIEQQTSKLSQLVSQLLDVSRIQSGRLTLELSAVDLSHLIEDTVATASTNPGKYMFIVTAPPVPLILADALRLEQVLINLIDNAIKYSPDGGNIEIALSLPDAKTLRMSVTDHGLGIPPEHREHIFERFYQAHGNGYLGGMGLGLYISRQIAELHGGQLNVEFPEAGGTCFILTLPVKGGNVSAAEAYTETTTNATES